MRRILFSIFLCSLGFSLLAQDTPNFNQLQWRSLGPAINSGRISDIEVHPENKDLWYLAAASGGVWKTENHGTSFEPIFDNGGSYSIGCIKIDQKHNTTIWLGTGENNNQRSVAYGDGIYKSVDGGKSWKNKGLNTSEHIGMISIDPDNSDRVFVAAYGPLWSKGGERGLYLTENGGEEWVKVLEVDEHTGINEVHFDPFDSNILYATAHQRRRHTWTYISGGPGSAIYKSLDRGKTWKKLTNGIPKKDLGRISVCPSPVQKDLIYAMIEGGEDYGGFYRSTDGGNSWKKENKYQTSGNYYVEIYCDPFDKDKVFSMDTWLHHTEDGGKTWKRTGEKNKHVDNHDIWIDPDNTDHWLVACDGGLYESWEAGNTYHFKPNLPITQFYKVATDNDYPFYNIYGGTQDNQTIGGPSRTINNAGIANSDWYITKLGDGFQTQVDPNDPNTIYSQAQYGSLVRFNKKTGESVYIKPMPLEEGIVLRWNWDAPLLISPHNPKRLYFAANYLFKSDDQGNNWERISDDLSRNLDRNKLKVMDRVWEIDAVAKNRSTSEYGNITAFDESSLKENLIAIGTDDGLIHISDDGGENYFKIDKINDVPKFSYINDIVFSKHDQNTVYAVLNNHKQGDFKPYIYKSIDKGRSWTNCVGNLPEKGSVYCLVEDHIEDGLLFCGTEYGAFFTTDFGQNWIKLKKGIPTIAIRDLSIQERENDLVAASFGRGFYIVDNYSSLRELDSITDKDFMIFNIKEALLYAQSNPYGTRGKASKGESYFLAKNPQVGVWIDYYLKEKPETGKEKREKEQTERRKSEKETNYPSQIEIEAEDLEKVSELIFVITDAENNIIRKVNQSPKKGINRFVWDGRLASLSPIRLKDRSPGRYGRPDWGPLVSTGTYGVEVFMNINGELKSLGARKSFKVKQLFEVDSNIENVEDYQNFNAEISDLYRSVLGSYELLKESENRQKHIEKSIKRNPMAPLELLSDCRAIGDSLYVSRKELFGNSSLRKRYYSTAPSLYEQVSYAYGNSVSNSQMPTGTDEKMYDMASKKYYSTILPRIKETIKDLRALENKLTDLGGAYTPGRDENWKEE